METDDEQVEKLKNWWQENGKAVIAGIIIGVGGLGGYRWYDDHIDSRAEAASSHFEQMVKALDANETEKARDQAELLVADYDESDYGVMGHFTLAKLWMEEGEFARASEELKLVVGVMSSKPLGYLARQRLAQVQVEMKDLDKALSTLSADFPVSFQAAVEELRGDIYALKGQSGEAAEAYQRAQRGNPGPANSQFLQQKIDDLGLTG
jgi:predicted negative regulator of RcsB-dependent stress response